jgi:hypothetical protein
MTATALILNSLAGRGISLRVTPAGHLAIRPASLLTDEDRVTLADLKPAIITALSGSAKADTETQPGSATLKPGARVSVLVVSTSARSLPVTCGWMPTTGLV